MMWAPYQNIWIVKQLIDQSAHFLIAFGVIAIALVIPGPWNGLLLGFALGVVREATEKDGLNWRSVLDVVFWSLGGLVAGLFA